MTLKKWLVKENNKCYVEHTCKVSTNENWAPTINGKLTLSAMWFDASTNSGLIRICIWGGDDFGMEKDFSPNTLTFNELKDEADMIPEPVTVEWLRQHGFINA